MVMEMVPAAAAERALAPAVTAAMVPPLLPGRAVHVLTPGAAGAAGAVALQAQVPMALPAMLVAAAVPVVLLMVVVPVAPAVHQQPLHY